MGRALGYWAAQEQYSMQDLLKFVTEAEKSGFATTMTSDHFHPWWHDGAFGNFTWIWMAAAAENTKRMQFVTGVTAPVYRYHPAIIAQAFASLDVLYPGRIGLGLGSGEAMNEAPLGFDWPRARARLARTKEAIQIIKELWGQGVDDEGFVNFNGEYFLIRDAKLYTPPSTKIPVYMAATGKQAAKVAAQYSDGLITYLPAAEAGKVLHIFDATAEKEGRDKDSLEKIAEYKVSFSEDYDEAFKSATFWRATLIKNVFDSDISDPRSLQQKAESKVPDEKIKQAIQITTSIEDCIKSIEDYFKVGFTRVYVHSTSPDEIKFIQMFSKKVMPHFSIEARGSRKTTATSA
ncbi:TIGR03557 family F420-dependent LLM class oxidoreductase [Candidatus Nitrososphaera gargensis]|uniref:TIGR03557 family F420-dependent LLM class oxidoreductase n=1 Tax=Candidatus Nitrososphaera gargensis TaxID=497727 RepID=UPI0011E50424|nr:TIGR03557 family F420-dependent LLM class oxidoreductase [Candidatus Nitrososphaera gargensis]